MVVTLTDTLPGGLVMLNPGGTGSLSLIVMVATDGDPRLAPVAADNTTVKVSTCSYTALLMSGTSKNFSVASLLVQFNVPLVAVKSNPATAVPLDVW